MTPERWARVKAVFQAAIERPPEERAALLAAAAGDDESLRRDVESLLVSDAAEGSLLDVVPAAANGLRGATPGAGVWTQAADAPPLYSPHQRLGSYEVIGWLGAGAMSQVYRVRDTQLNREVALKVLPVLFAGDPDRLARFKREAQLLAALNHTNIAAIYGFEESADVSALVLELVDGPTLADRIAQGRLALDAALAIAKQIAEALEAAHEQGIVHRDLKPSNVQVRPDGVVKVLDFGLAKALAPEPAAQDADGMSPSPTVNAPATRDGIILGTAAYMSPEQARGLSVDKRGDIWAFGCVLYEMLAGVPAFRGHTVTDLLAAVVKDDPDWAALPADVPPAVRRLIERCLTKDPRQRLQAIGDARIEIDDVQRLPRPAAVAGPSRLGVRERSLWVAAVSVLAVITAAALFRASRASPVPLETRLEVTTAATTDPASMALAPDGQTIVFSAVGGDGRPQLWLRVFADAAPRPLPGTDGARYPFWSPDSRSIAFFANGRLKRIDVDGGTPREIADAPLGLGGTWNRDDTIVFAPNWVGPLRRVSASGGPIADVTRLTPQQTGHRFPQFLPDGRHVLFESIEGGGISGVVYVGSLDGPDSRRLIESGSAATYSPSGHLVFARGAPAAATLMAQPFDADRLELSGEPSPIAAAVAVGLDPGSAALTVSTAGPIAYRAESGTGRRQFVWFDRSGKALGTVGNTDAGNPLNPALSPDGRYVAFRRSLGENTDIWLLDIGTGLLGRVTASTGLHNFPVWSPDSRHVAFTANHNRGGVNDFFQKAADGTGAEELLLATPQNKGLADWSSDGRYLVFRNVDPKTGNDLWAVSLADRKPFPVVQTDFDERDAQFSPDGRWIAYQSNETGSFEIWARPFPGPGTRVRVSDNGGTQVRWRADGKEIFYVGMDGRLVAVRIGYGPEGLIVDRPTPLFATRIGGALQGFNRHQYAVARNGQRFLMNTIAAEGASTITVIQNWAGPRQ